MSFVNVAIGATLILVPAIAWTAWLRRPRPRRIPLLVVALATTAPPAVVLAGTIRIVILVRSMEANENTDPSEKALLLAETISTVMNGTALAVIGAAAISGVVAVASHWRGRDRTR